MPRNRARMSINPTALLDVSKGQTYSKRKLPKIFIFAAGWECFRANKWKKEQEIYIRRKTFKIKLWNTHSLSTREKYTHAGLLAANFWTCFDEAERKKKKNYKTKRRFEIMCNISKVLHVCSRCRSSSWWWWSQPTGHLVLLRNWMVYLSSTSRWERLRFIRWPTFL